MSVLDGLKSKITYENKTIIGVVGIVLAIFFWIIVPSMGIISALICVLPAILLIIPSTSIKNSKALGIITGIILIIWLMAGLSHFYTVVTDYMPMSIAFESGYVETMFLADILQIILVFYGLFCAFLLTIQTEPKTGFRPVKHPQVNNNEIKHDQYCSECGAGLNKNAKFCSSCGNKVN